MDTQTWQRVDDEWGNPTPQPRRSDGGPGWRVVIVSALVSALVAAAVTLGLADRLTEEAAAEDPAPAVQEVRDDEPAAEAPAQDGEPAAEAPSGVISQVAEQVLPSVALVNVNGPRGQGSGSAVVYSSDGLLVTNNHVVRDAVDVEVQLADGTIAEAEIVGTDPRSDLAVLRIDQTGLPVPDYAETSPDVGATAIAIGSPFGLESTVTSGIISADERIVSGGPGEAVLVGMLQTDAAINPGNSGGALVNDRGEIIGINTAIFSTSGSNAGIGFAIPVDTVRQVADALIEDGVVEYAFLGIQPQSITEEVADQFGLATSDGAIIATVVPGSAADRAGLQVGDIITAVGDFEVTEAGDVYAALREFAPGDETTITYLRDGQERQADVTLQASQD